MPAGRHGQKTSATVLDFRLFKYRLVVMKKIASDPVMKKALKLFEESGKSLDEVGTAMGHSGETARKAAWQFLNKVHDPRLSSLRKFAAAMGVDVKELL